MLRKIFFILVFTLCLAPVFCLADVYISAQEAVKNIFADYQEYKAEKHIVDNQEFTAYTVFKDSQVIGWAVALDEMGKINPITFLVGIDKNGSVLEMYVLEFRDLFGAEIKRRSFLRQFRGKSLKDNIAIGRDIDAVTQATISSRVAASAVRKALSLVEKLRNGF
jgi:Na+-translocating ferredoxin:NAD+ oxidoreductase RnfG subunit